MESLSSSSFARTSRGSKKRSKRSRRQHQQDELFQFGGQQQLSQVDLFLEKCLGKICDIPLLLPASSSTTTSSESFKNFNNNSSIISSRNNNSNDSICHPSAIDDGDCLYHVNASSQKCFKEQVATAAATAAALEAQRQPQKEMIVKYFAGKVFRVIRVKRNLVRIQLCQLQSSSSSGRGGGGIYISNMIEDTNNPSGLKVGMRILAINNKECPDTLELAVRMMQQQHQNHQRQPKQYTDDDYDDGIYETKRYDDQQVYMTLVTSEDYDCSPNTTKAYI